jgi:N-acetylglucosaminyldiphosphoundecaprenol N-acetyl-beta-D-mannosaminyltransferase
MNTLNRPRKTAVIGVGISTTSYSEVTEVCDAWLDAARASEREHREVPGRYVCVTSVHGIISAYRDRSLQRILNNADIATPDGVPVVWALRSLGHRKQQRVYGPELTLALCERAQSCGYRVFLYGGSDNALRRVRERLSEKYPNLNLVGSYSPPFRPLTPEEDEAIVAMIRQSEAELVFIGLSTPKQEYWMADHQTRLPNTVMIGVGAAFDFHAGTLKQASRWMQRMGLEWLFRLLVEPRRLWRRYLLVTPLFLPLWALQRAGLLRMQPGLESREPKNSA